MVIAHGRLWLLLLLVVLFLFSSHVSIENPHKIGSNVSHLRSIDGHHFVNGRQGVLFRHHFEFGQDLVVSSQFLLGKVECQQPLVNGWGQLVSHGNRGTPREQGAFLDSHIPSHDPKEVGPMVPDPGTLELDGIVVFLQGIVD